MTAIGEHRQLHASGTAIVEQRLDRGAHGAAREQHVVDDHHGASGHVEVDVRGVHDRGIGAALEIVAIEADIQVSERDLGIEQLFQLILQSMSEKGAATMDTDDRNTPLAGVALGDLVSDAHQRSLDVPLVEDDLLVGSLHASFLASRDRVKGAISGRLYQRAVTGSLSAASRSRRSDQRISSAGPRSGKGISIVSKSRGASVAANTARACSRSSRPA